jgi:LacI family transcriptional regulator
MAVTIQDVAKAASVSVATVSRVVNNIPLVSEDTKQRVLLAIEELGYEPNEVARSLKIRKTNTIGIILDDITRPQHTTISRGATDACWMNGYNVILANTDAEQVKEDSYLKVLMQKQCDGILIISRKITKNFGGKLETIGIPIVLGAISDDEKQFTNVSIDNTKAGYDATKYLYENGHADVGYIMMKQDQYKVCEDRIDGFKTAVEEFDLNTKEEWCIESAGKRFSEHNAIDGYEAMEQILNSKQLPTAIITANDEIALGAIRCIEARGLKVPLDISVLGFNDYWLSEWVKPQITTVAYPMYDVGAVCASLLIKKIKSGSSELNANDSMVIPHDIVIRQSVRNLNE